MTSYDVINNKLKSGTKLYACAYEYSLSKEHKQFYSKPVLGVLSFTNKSYEKDQIDTYNGYPEYFIPYKKNRSDDSYDNLAFSKAVSIYARYYAETETECAELYNSLIQNNIDWHKKEIEKLKENLI